MSKEDGGPAFPLQEQMQEAANGEQWLSPAQAGMSLRDYFAAQALLGYVHRYGPHDVVGVDPFRELAESAYAMADAMLEARKR